jgi:hypothetical protein
MQAESGTARTREPADQVIDGFTRRADKEQFSRRSERPDEFSCSGDPFGRRRRLQDSKHASWQRNAVGGGESNATIARRWIPSGSYLGRIFCDYTARVTGLKVRTSETVLIVFSATTAGGERSTGTLTNAHAQPTLP